MLPWYNIWSIFIRPLQNLGRPQRGYPHTASTKNCLIVRLCKSDSASTAGIQDLDVGREDAFEKEIEGKWHVITPQEASEYVDHDILTSRFHVTRYGGCANLYNKDTFYSNIDVKSIYLHDTRRELPDKVMEEDPVWVLQVVLSRASFRRPPLSGQKTFRCCP